ncbi:hypothetical protein [Paenibacillus sp. URB8-2]|uniref:hypothetical protein n=1 Tax=Paenibacillus sp. URB8-2 TaxID=2741301 RepID=UPI0015B867B1|nr:hypothetical protein [Paenibacillus sp. URB8-2]BCG60029.1 hypothetical protein PUR_34540 [Paenibacillus sp. URB8-2]
MSTLDGNQHNVINNEDRSLLRDYILTGHIETMVQKSVSEIEYSTNILKRLYLVAGHYILEQIAQDLRRLRRDLKQRNIKFVKDEQDDLIVYHYFTCRGYQERFPMTRDLMRAEISVRLTRYIADAGELLKIGST